MTTYGQPTSTHSLLMYMQYNGRLACMSGVWWCAFMKTKLKSLGHTGPLQHCNHDNLSRKLLSYHFFQIMANGTKEIDIDVRCNKKIILISMNWSLLESVFSFPPGIIQYSLYLYTQWTKKQSQLL